jgi:hypothetical protein
LQSVSPRGRGISHGKIIFGTSIYVRRCSDAYYSMPRPHDNRIMIIGHLEINSWRGISIGAVHWYAKLIIENNNEVISRTELQRKITAKEAANLNKELQERGYDFCDRNRAGDLTTGFNTEEQAIKIGINTFKKKYPNGILFKGNRASGSAWKNVIYYPEQCRNHVLVMEFFAKEFQKLNGYECKPHFQKIVELLDSQWGKIYEQVTKM